MKIYRIFTCGDIKTFGCKNDTKENNTACSFNGNPIENWKPIHLSERLPENPKMKEKLGDVSFVVGTTPLLTPKAYEILYPYIKDYAQLLETTTDYGNMFLVNVTNVNDCLNYDSSEILRFPFPPHRIMRIDKFGFFEERLKDVELFQIPEMNNSFPFVTEGLKNIIEENGLVGFRFELIYG